MLAPTRRTLLLGGSTLLAMVSSAALAQNAMLVATDFGVVPGAGSDQTKALQSAIDSAAAQGKPLFLAAGRYTAKSLRLASNLVIQGVPGATIIQGRAKDPLVLGENAQNIHLQGLTFDGAHLGPDDAHAGLVQLTNCASVRITDCGLRNARGNLVYMFGCSGQITSSAFEACGLTALFASTSKGMRLSGNHLTDCGSGGIRIFRSENGPDGTIITENRISNIRSAWGNGQNGNGINIYMADEVIVADNHITDCDFSAVRANSTNNTIIRGNQISECREVAIFSEFAFTGSIIADNLIDEAAQGISITNFNDGGRLAVCSGNMVRNIWDHSPTNPDTVPVGIFAEADCAITGNVVETIPGVGILAGWGPHLRNVLISNNVVRATDYGIGASVADGAGQVQITDNLIASIKTAPIAAFEWSKPVATDLATRPDQYSNLAIANNSVADD